MGMRTGLVAGLAGRILDRRERRRAPDIGEAIGGAAGGEAEHQGENADAGAGKRGVNMAEIPASHYWMMRCVAATGPERGAPPPVNPSLTVDGRLQDASGFGIGHWIDLATRAGSLTRAAAWSG